MRVRMMVVAAGAVLAAACSESNAPTGLAGPGPLFEIVDGNQGGNSSFFWLPPIVLGSSGGGSNLTGLEAEVKVFDCAATPPDDPCSTLGSAVADFTTLTGPGSETVRDGGDHYIVNWHTDRGLSVGRYRICVSVDDLNLGHADVLVGSNGKDVKDARANGYVPLVAGSTLPIKFRVEDGYLTGESDAGCPGGGSPSPTLLGMVISNGSPVLGVTVTLFDNSVPPVALGSRTTAEGGSYSFVDLIPPLALGSTYTVCAPEIVGQLLLGANASTCPPGWVGFTETLAASLWFQPFVFAPLPPPPPPPPPPPN